MSSGIRFPSRDARETYNSLARILAAHGIEKPKYVWLKRHPAIEFVAAGEVRRIPFAASSKDRNQVRSASRQLERELRKWNILPIGAATKEPVEKSEKSDEDRNYMTQEEPVLDGDGSNEPETQEMTSPSEATEDFESAATTESSNASVPTEEQREWDERFVRFASEKQLLYVPPPQNPVILIEVERDLMIPKGHFLSIDPISGIVTFVTPSEARRYRPNPRNATHIHDALKIYAETTTESERPMPVAPQMQPAQQVAPAFSPAPIEPEQTMLVPEPDEQPLIEEPAENQMPSMTPRPKVMSGNSRSFFHSPVSVSAQASIAPQIGRLIVVMECLRRITGRDKFDSNTLGEHLEAPDRRAIGASISALRTKGFIVDAGNIPGSGRAKWYQLTVAGQRKAAELGEVPFVDAGKKPTPLLVQASRVSVSRERAAAVDLPVHD